MLCACLFNLKTQFVMSKHVLGLKFEERKVMSCDPGFRSRNCEYCTPWAALVSIGSDAGNLVHLIAHFVGIGQRIQIHCRFRACLQIIRNLDCDRTRIFGRVFYVKIRKFHTLLRPGTQPILRDVSSLKHNIALGSDRRTSRKSDVVAETVLGDKFLEG